MLSRLVREHTQKQQAIRKKNELLRKEAIQAVNETADALTDALNERVSLIFKTQREIESESRQLSTATARYTKQTKQWLTMVENFSNALKELGDVENWAQVIEKDMRDIALTLEFVHKGTIGGEVITSPQPITESTSTESSSAVVSETKDER
ncbi:10795_t:CDS:2 [Paraglomus brasilianum]|uniref:Biogenesis of lysosome-related organelles complex 1 subunit 1 n=1 Tax=Paraglomus brasilianum TaxID=144538 RepID=A0A9N9A830_9GLOM|nr:10795_t:CDS:2 [Paraglomus brasilianum]